MVNGIVAVSLYYIVLLSYIQSTRIICNVNVGKQSPEIFIVLANAAATGPIGNS
jgi:hypothetical protein